MPLHQQKYREIVFQILYSYDLGEANDEEMIPLIMKELSVTKKSVKLALEKVEAVRGHQDEIDALIKKILVSYDFPRVQTVERNILRLGIYEILYDETIPEKVAIVEAMRLSRKFSTPESSSFINAILDAVVKQETTHDP